MKKIAIFASGSGSNFEALVHSVKEGELAADIRLLVCDRPGARVIDRAKNNGISSCVFSVKDFPDKASYEEQVLKELEKAEVEYIVLAGYMRLIGPVLLQAFTGKIINIHPSLLPAYPGQDAIGQALSDHAKMTGVTIHYVDEGMDTGPIIAQKEISMDDHETMDSLQAKIHSIEHEFYPKVLQKLFT